MPGPSRVDRAKHDLVIWDSNLRVDAAGSRPAASSRRHTVYRSASARPSAAASEPADSADQLRSGAVAADDGRAVWAGRTSSGIEHVAHHEDLRLRDATQGCTITSTMHRSVEHLTTPDRRSVRPTRARRRLARLEVLLLLTHLSRRHRAQLITASSRRNHNLAASHTRRLSASASQPDQPLWPSSLGARSRDERSWPADGIGSDSIRIGERRGLPASSGPGRP